MQNHYENEKKTGLGVAHEESVHLACESAQNQALMTGVNIYLYLLYMGIVNSVINLSGRKVEQVHLSLRFDNVHVGVDQAL